MVLELLDVVRTYRSHQAVRAVDGVSLGLSRGEWVALVGPSGCGKSTLLQLAGLLDRPDSGRVLLEGLDTTVTDEGTRTRLRRGRLATVFQFFHLLPTLSVRENVALPLHLNGLSLREARARVEALLGRLGLSERADHHPHQLSGGQMQRVAIARALVHRPALILADEPTGNLDSHTGEEVLDLLGRITREEGATLLMVTHDREAARRADRVLVMRDGRLVGSPA
ncbi:MAG: ABC transporter ATP-binding protein [bacterium]|nr:ABC transporter ATP-binding protein [bacterium]